MSPPPVGAPGDGEITRGRLAPSSVVRPPTTSLSGPRRSHRGLRSAASRRLRVARWFGRVRESTVEMEIFRDESAPTSSPSSTMPCPLPVARGEDLSSTPGGFRGADGTIFRHDHLFVAGVQSQTSRSVVSPRESHRSEPPNGDGSGDNSSRGRTGQSSPSTPSISDTFSIFHLNPQGIGTAAKQAEFDTLLQHYQHPTIVGVTETWLTRTTDTLTFSGYKRVSRLDRRVGRPDRGGIALFALDSFAENVVHIGDSPVDERSWHIIHCDCGPVLLCLWYRPPNRDEIESIQRFEQELSNYSRDTVAVIVVGDMNVHNEIGRAHV